jgi:hypothetical protein
MSHPVYGMMAELNNPDDLIKSVKAARAAGYTRLDAFSPFPLREVAENLDVRTTVIPWIAVIAGFIGAAIQYGTQYWMNGIDYPLNVGGRPLNSWPAFIPSALIVAILWAGLSTLVCLLAILRLPRLHHPVFAMSGFERASEDRFFICVLSEDPLFETAEVRHFLETLSPQSIEEVPACG